MENIENILKTVIDSNDDVWFFVASDYSILYFNQKAFENGKLLHKRELKTGDSLLDYARDTKNNVDESLIINFNKALLGEHIQEEKEVNYESTSMWTLAKYIPVYKENALLGVSIAISDITKQKRLEEAELKSKQHIELLLKRRDEFSSITSHELKAPIAGIKGYIQLLERRAADENLPVYQRILGKANEQVKKLTQMVDDLLDVTRIETGKLKLYFSELNLKVLLDDCISILQPNTHIINIEGDTDLMLTADKNRLEQVICNLLTNAMKYSAQQSEIIISVRTEGNKLFIAIKDNGVGIKPEKRESLFNPFYRTDESNLNKSGLGLGLYISGHIIESHGGRIDVESEVNRGSTFTIMLPLPDAPAAT